MFGKKKEDGPAAPQPADAITKMREQEQAMEKRMAFLQKKIDDEVRPIVSCVGIAEAPNRAFRRNTAPCLDGQASTACRERQNSPATESNGLRHRC